MAKAVKVTFSVESQRLLDDFRAACRKRRMKYSTILSAAMRYFVAHPSASGWVNGEEVIKARKLFDLEGKTVKPLAELIKPKRSRKKKS